VLWYVKHTGKLYQRDSEAESAIEGEIRRQQVGAVFHKCGVYLRSLPTATAMSTENKHDDDLDASETQQEIIIMETRLEIEHKRHPPKLAWVLLRYVLAASVALQS
jgi:hypothetical protein